MAEQVAQSEHAETAGHADHAGHVHINYVRIWFILVVLLVVSVIGPMFEIQVLTLVTAFGIAAVKAYLVARNFMHLSFEKRFIGYIVATCLVFMLLFFAGTAPDVMKKEGTRWEKPLWLERAAAWEAGHSSGGEAAGAHH